MVRARTLTARERNRALLARQMLLERARTTPVRALDRLVGMQSQLPSSPYVAMWSRLADFDPMALSRAIAGRKAARIALMRSTIHLVTANDALYLRPLIVPVLRRELTSPTFRVPLDGVDLDELGRHARELLEGAPMTPAQLGTALAEDFPGREPRALAHAARTLLPLVQLPPRGLWDASGPTTLATAEQWLRRPVADDASWDVVAWRYLGAFGPAGVADLVAWSKVTGLAAVLERLRPRLRVFRDESGRELFDQPRAPRPPADTPAPPRFLPDFDNVLLSHADRNHVFDDAHRKGMQTSNGTLPGTVLLDGTVAATWRVEKDEQRLVIRELDSPKSARPELRAEGERLALFLTSGAHGSVAFE